MQGQEVVPRFFSFVGVLPLPNLIMSHPPILSTQAHGFCYNTNTFCPHPPPHHPLWHDSAHNLCLPNRHRCDAEVE
jgi:hypothetical protein